VSAPEDGFGKWKELKPRVHTMSEVRCKLLCLREIRMGELVLAMAVGLTVSGVLGLRHWISSKEAKRQQLSARLEGLMDS